MTKRKGRGGPGQTKNAVPLVKYDIHKHNMFLDETCISHFDVTRLQRFRF